MACRAASNLQRGSVVNRPMPSSARHPSAARSARFARRGTARGFTLIEIVAAFAILALGLGLTMQMVEINSKNVDSITREGKTYLYFTAGFSPFAAAMEPVYQKFLMEAEQYDVKVCRINVTDDIALGERFHVKDLPTMLVFRDGMRVHTTEGIVLPEHYTNLLKFY